MIAARKLARFAAIAVVPLLVTPVVATPAAAHGSVDSPASRVVACRPNTGEKSRSAACKAAVAASAQGFGEWDNLRVSGVDGRDRELIPDGQLCSAGKEEYKGLDLARKDWPATKLKPGAKYTFKYRGTIPHPGTFKLYVTKNGYQPTEALSWSDLEVQPFLSVTDPGLRDGSYVMSGKLPAGKKGRHLIYTIWQTSDSSDTYYACSDVIFGTTGGSSGGATAPATTAKKDAPTGTRLTATSAPESTVSRMAPLAFGVAALLLVIAVYLVLFRRGAYTGRRRS